MRPAPWRRRDSCRGCGGTNIEQFLALGPQPLANAFLSSPAEFANEQRYPLDACICLSCGLVQILDVVDPTILFANYPYVTGTSITMAEHNRAYAREVQSRLSLRPGDLVVEVASNDGSLLACFDAPGIRRLGIEPAQNIADIAVRRGIDTVDRFFDSSVAREIAAAVGPARAVLANNVLAHVDDPVDFLVGCRELLANGGQIVVEVPYAGDMLARGEYDTIYHEHLSYFALGPLSRLAARAGLAILHVDSLPVHGGSMRIWLSPHGSISDSVTELQRREDRTGVANPERWHRFASDAVRNRDALRDLLARLRSDASSLAAYGAPAKGNTLLNFCSIGPDLLPFTVDRNPFKVGRLTPGMHIPVLDVQELGARKPDNVLILAWNLAPEIVRQQAPVMPKECRWLVPIPEPQEFRLESVAGATRAS